MIRLWRNSGAPLPMVAASETGGSSWRLPYRALRQIPDWLWCQCLLRSGWMLRRLIAIGVFVLALAPSVYLAWTYRAMPHLGYYHDDSIYLVSGKSLATGQGYRISSLPGEPYQTKYPPLYSALLAIVWRIDPNFPSNLPIATLLAWLLLPAYLSVGWRLLRAFCLSWREVWPVVGLSGVVDTAAGVRVSLLVGPVCL